MRVQIEQLDLLGPWPRLSLREGYRDLRVQVWLGSIPVGLVAMRPRNGTVPPGRLRRLVAKRLHDNLLRILVEESLRAGPGAIRAFPQLGASFSADWPRHTQAKFVEQVVLGDEGLARPLRDVVASGQSAPWSHAPPVTVVVCTRNRPDNLRVCLDSLLRLTYRDYEVLIIDNGADPAASRSLCQQRGVRFAHVPQPGLSLARNAAMRLARHGWVAFTDDDCQPDPQWLRWLVEPTADTRCGSVTGLVLPARLHNQAEVTFEEYGGLTRGFRAAVFGDWFFRDSRFHPPHTWRIGAGANMLVKRDLALSLGGYDEDLGAGRPAGCSEDTDLWYAMLRAGWTVHYAPRAVVHHWHRATPEALVRQLRAYAAGHAAAHWRCLWRWGDWRALVHLMHDLPYSLWWRWRQTVRGRSSFPLALLRREIAGTLAGPFAYTAAKIRRLVRWVRGRRDGESLPVVEDFSETAHADSRTPKPAPEPSRAA